MSKSKKPAPPEATPQPGVDRAPELDKLEGFVYVPEAYQSRTTAANAPDSLAKAFDWVKQSRRDSDRW
jgi:hypothetical protein